MFELLLCKKISDLIFLSNFSGVLQVIPLLWFYLIDYELMRKKSQKVIELAENELQ